MSSQGSAAGDQGKPVMIVLELGSQAVASGNCGQLEVLASNVFHCLLDEAVYDDVT